MARATRFREEHELSASLARRSYQQRGGPSPADSSFKRGGPTIRCRIRRAHWTNPLPREGEQGDLITTNARPLHGSPRRSAKNVLHYEVFLVPFVFCLVL